MKKKYKFQLEELENTAINSIKKWKVEDTEMNKTAMFISIKNLAFAVLRVGSKFQNLTLDKHKVSYEYALYLYERIVTGSFKMEPKTTKEIKVKDKFPLQVYVDINLMHITTSMKKDETSWYSVITDLKYVLEQQLITNVYAEKEESENKLMEDVRKNKFSDKLLEALKLHYSMEEIHRLFGLSVEMIFNSKNQPINDSFPNDIKNFSFVLISSAKRIAKDYDIGGIWDMNRKDFERALFTSTRSSIFLSTILSSDIIPKELLLSLDMDSLYRLVFLCGGKKIRIPSLRDLDTVLGTVVSVSKMLTENKDLEKAISLSKKELELKFSGQVNTRDFIKKALKTFEIFRNDSSAEPLINILLTCVNSIEPVLLNMVEKTKNSPQSEDVIRMYSELVKSTNGFTQSLLSISNTYKEKNDENNS